MSRMIFCSLDYHIYLATSLPIPTVVSANISEQREILIRWEVGASVCGGVQFTVGTSCPGCSNRTLSDMTNLTCVDVSADGSVCVIIIQTETTLCGISPSTAAVVSVFLRGM